ncbi:MAG: ChaN family lipoprotein [Gemmatimonadaceae bacterium]|nr:ChaN family lipoprotein [Gemmatimonadaceae bacterium]
MTTQSFARVAPLLAAVLAFTGCTGTRAGGAATNIAPVPAGAGAAAPRVVEAGGGQTIPFSRLADEVSRADVVFFGEQHDDEETHRAELALLTAIGERRRAVVLSLEMFERDVQSLVDAYLAGTLSEADFRAQSRPWPNYGADYRPLVELAKARGWPVVASNVPRRLASTVSRRGLPAVDSLPAADRGLVARDLACPKDKYYANFVEVMGAGHGGPPPAAGARPMADLFYESQCVKDETMAEAIATAFTKAGGTAIVVHFNGAFHSDFGLGTAARVRRRLPSVRTVVVSAVPVPAPATANAAEYLDRGQFIILPQRIKP